jgi:DNA transposition AAA+ family ATPase
MRLFEPVDGIGDLTQALTVSIINPLATMFKARPSDAVKNKLDQSEQALLKITRTLEGQIEPVEPEKGPSV